MKFKQLAILLPSHSWEDFPVYHRGQDAASLLASWTSLWHPELLAQCESIPRWQRIDQPPESCTDWICLVPSISASQLPAGLRQRFAAEGGMLIEDTRSRDQIMRAIFGGQLPETPAAEFFALGYGYLQVQLMTRQLRYSSNLDEVQFQKTLIQAARQMVAGATELASVQLSSCANQLVEERCRYYPTDAQLADYVLLGPAVADGSLLAQLKLNHPMNLVCDGQTLDKLADDNPDGLTAVRHGLENGTLTMVGGEQTPLRSSLVSCTSLLNQLRRGRETFARHLGQVPSVFGRRTFGLVPALPGMLGLGRFHGAVHATLDGGQFPVSSQSVIRWEGAEDCIVTALGGVPLDANAAENFLKLGITIGEAIDLNHSAMIVLAHWCGQCSDHYRDLIQLQALAPVLGRMVPITDLLRDAPDPGYTERFTADQYRTPYFTLAVQGNEVDPISRFVDYWDLLARQRAAEGLAAMHWMSSVGGKPECWPLREADTTLLDDLTEHHPCDRPAIDLTAGARRVAESLGAGQGGSGWLVINPLGFSRRQVVNVDTLQSLRSDCLHAADRSGSGSVAVLDVPAMGFAYLSPTQAGTGRRRRRGRRPRPLAGGHTLQNEFFEIVIDPQSGGIRSVHRLQRRGNLLSQRLALRLPATTRSRSGAGGQYSEMRADQIEITQNDDAVGEITSHGRLVVEGESVASYTQRMRIARGRRILEFSFKLQPQRTLPCEPWNSYYCSRFAWDYESAILYRTVNQSRDEVTQRRFDAPNYVEINVSGDRTTLFTFGLPYHRRVDRRMLDCILIASGESRREFNMAMGVDISHPARAALDLAIPPIVVSGCSAPRQGEHSGWLLHLDCKNVMILSWEPSQHAPQGRGVVALLKETEGRSARLSIRCAAPLRWARELDLDRQVTADCPTEGDKVQVVLGGHQIKPIELSW